MRIPAIKSKLGAVILIGVAVLTVYWLVMPFYERWPFSWSGAWQWLGWLVALGAMLLMESAEWALATRGQGSGFPFDPPRQLVARGPYRWVRNPIYLAAFASILSVAFFLESLEFLLLALIFLPAMHLYVVLVEEPRLERRFGESYREYKRLVPRWIPRRPRMPDILEREKE